MADGREPGDILTDRRPTTASSTGEKRGRPADTGDKNEQCDVFNMERQRYVSKFSCGRSSISRRVEIEDFSPDGNVRL
jgi:hypothetical protein